MERTIRPKVVIDKDGWHNVIIEQDFIIPPEATDHQVYVDREKMMRYVNNHPNRLYYYNVGGNQYSVDCKGWGYIIRKWMEAKNAREEDILSAIDISNQFHYLTSKISELSRRALKGGSRVNGILDARTEDLLDLFGRLHSIDEVHRMILQDWNLSVSIITVRNFYNRNIKEIERLRDQYVVNYSDLSLSKKRARLDKLSVMFYTYFNKWHQDERLDYSRELRAILDQIKKEVEGEQININVQGQINVDLTMEVNKTLFEAYKRVPVNNLIIALVAAKKGIDPTRLMTQLTTSYYRSLTGYGKYEPEKELVHPVDLTYNWNEIDRKHKMKDKSVVIEDVQIVESTGRLESDAEMNTVKNKLLQILDKDKAMNNSRKSR